VFHGVPCDSNAGNPPAAKAATIRAKAARLDKDRSKNSISFGAKGSSKTKTRRRAIALLF